MEDSILTSTKKLLGLAEEYTAFDLDIITLINSSFSIINQVGIGEAEFLIEDSSANWSDLSLPQNQVNLLKAYIPLKVRMAFDPPTTSFHIEAINNQIKELEYRLNDMRESLIPIQVIIVEEVEPIW